MIKEIKNILLIILTLALLTGAYFTYLWFHSRSTEKKEKNATVLLERIQKVVKLTTVEANFSELFEQKSFTYFDILPFQKKVIVRVKAKVAAGYDFEGLRIEIDSTQHIIWINNLPEPKILYVDHTLDYYDISEGLFTSFDAADYNKIQEEAKNLIIQKANESNVLTEAKAQGIDLVDLMKSLSKASGWDLKVRSRPLIQ